MLWDVEINKVSSDSISETCLYFLNIPGKPRSQKMVGSGGRNVSIDSAILLLLLFLRLNVLCTRYSDHISRFISYNWQGIDNLFKSHLFFSIGSFEHVWKTQFLSTT